MGTLTWQEPDAPQRTLKITFTVLVGEDWVPIEQCLADVPGVVDAYLRTHQVCCSFQGGFFVDVDGKPWSDDGTVDEFRMTMTWFGALSRLCQGSATESVWAWEESGLTLVRDGEWLEMEDVHHTGDVVMARLRVPFVAFTEEVLREATRFATFVRLVRQEVGVRRLAGAGGDTEDITHHLPTTLDQDLAELRSNLGQMR